MATGAIKSGNDRPVQSTAKRAVALPLLFTYGTLQQESVQLSTFGRVLDGAKDELVGFEQSPVKIVDPDLVATLGRTHHSNVTKVGSDQSRVPGVAFEVDDAELLSVDEYETAFRYVRISCTLASARPAWVYVYSPSAE